MDVLELPRPVINFLRTISKEMSRYSLCWDIYGGSESVTLTLTWKINCDESDDEQLAKSRRQHQQQLNTLINMDLNASHLTDTNNANSSTNSTATANPINQSKHKSQQQTPSTPVSKVKQLQHSKLDRLLSNQSSQLSGGSCLFNSSSKMNNNKNETISSESYDPYMEMKKPSRPQQQQPAHQYTKTQVPRNFSAESNVLLKYNNCNEDDQDTLNSTLRRHHQQQQQQQQQHRSRRPKSNHSVERNQFSPQNITNRNEKLYSELGRAHSINFSTINDDDDNNNINDEDDEIYNKQYVIHPAKKILKYTRGKSLENFDYSPPIENTNHDYDTQLLHQQQQHLQQHRYCQSCSQQAHNQHNHQPAQQQQQPFISKNQYNHSYQQSQQQFIPRPEHNYYNPHQLQQKQQQHSTYHQYNQPQQQTSTSVYTNPNSNTATSHLIRISSNSLNNNNEKVCLNNQKLVLDNYNPYKNFPYNQSLAYSQKSSSSGNYMCTPDEEGLEQSASTGNPVQFQPKNHLNKITKQQNKSSQLGSFTSDPISAPSNRIIYSQTAIAKATCQHSSTSDSTSDSSSCESNCKQKNPVEHVIISTSNVSNNPNGSSVPLLSSSNSLSTSGNVSAAATASNNNTNNVVSSVSSNSSNSSNSNNSTLKSQQVIPTNTSCSSLSNPWIRRSMHHTEIKETESRVTESSFSKTSTSNEITGNNYEYTANMNNVNSNNNSNADYYTNISLPIMTSSINSGHKTSQPKVTFDPKLDKLDK